MERRGQDQGSVETNKKSMHQHNDERPASVIQHENEKKKKKKKKKNISVFFSLFPYFSLA